ncbi:MAG: TIGR01777 family protein [Flavobacteriales bacterium]|nr:TIGR01777 family protein [Flavobacteriales bacterium]
MKVLITGGSGLIGFALTKSLLSKGISVVHVTRYKNSKAGVKTYEWDYKREYLEQGALSDVTHIVHLAGAGIADKPWTMSRKREIVKSRVLTARLLLNQIKKDGVQIEKYISASGIGYYGAITIPETLTETSPRGSDFVAECCVQWENQANQFSELCPVTILRTGIVLARNEGALEKLESSIRRGMGAPIGNGQQIMPWIHIDDIVKMYEKAIFDNNFNGIYNAVNGSPVNNEQFTIQLAKALHKSIRLPKIPSFIIKMIFGELSEILLEGSKVSNKKVLETGFQFEFNDLETALAHIYQ